MYDEDEKQQLMKDLAEMETFKADVGDEGRILQNDLNFPVMQTTGIRKPKKKQYCCFF